MSSERKSTDRLVHILGMLGFLLSIVSLAWQVYLYRESFSERVILRLSALHLGQDIQTPAKKKGGYLSIEVVNVGQRPLYLRQVAINIPCASVERQGWVFYGTGKPNFETLRLESGASKTFQEQWDFAAHPLGIQNGAVEDACVTVESTKGEILRSSAEISDDIYGVPRVKKKGPDSAP